VWGFAPGDPIHAPSDLVALRGRYQVSDLDALGQLPEAAMYREHSLRGDAGDTAQWATVVHDDTLLLGSMAALHDGIDRLDGIFPGSGPTRPGYAEAAARARLGERDFSLVVVFTEALGAAGLMEQVQIFEEDTTLRVQLRASDEDTRALVDNVGSLLRMLFAGS